MSQTEQRSQLESTHSSHATKSLRPAKRARTVLVFGNDERENICKVSPSKSRHVEQRPSDAIPTYSPPDSENGEQADMFGMQMTFRTPPRFPPCEIFPSSVSPRTPLTSPPGSRSLQQPNPLTRLPGFRPTVPSQDTQGCEQDEHPSKRDTQCDGGTLKHKGIVMEARVFNDENPENAISLVREGGTEERNSDAMGELPDDFEYPSPPPSSSEDLAGESEKPPDDVNGTDIAPSETWRRPPVVESFEPSVNSQDSVYFKFDERTRGAQRVQPPAPILPLQKDPVRAQHKKEETAKMEDEKVESPNVEHMEEAVGGLAPVERKLRRYYIAAFHYVITEVVKRYWDVLRPYDLEVASRLQNDITPNALALFVRVYRRKAQWYNVKGLENSYSTEANVESAISELCLNRLIISSRHASSHPDKTLRFLLAKEVLSTCNLRQVKEICASVPDGHKLRKLPVPAMVDVLQGMLRGRQKRAATPGGLRQTTLTGISPAERLANVILRTAGHCIEIPKHVLLSLERMHFLFFLDEGHDSPNVILGDTGKAQFPKYECQPRSRVFQSSYAFEEYETALRLERRLNSALDQKDYARAAHFGSIAELEACEFLSPTGTQERQKQMVCSPARPSCTGQSISGSARSGCRKTLNYMETKRQLEHPFFRRYTSQWVYVRCAWHSVNALERLKEYENAVSRLRLLLATGLVPRRQGKCLNRLTINLFKHLDRPQEALDVTLNALRDSSQSLHFGDRIGLAGRGINIHRKLATPKAKEKFRNTKTKSGRKNVVVAEVASTRPQVLVDVLKSTETKIRVRKIHGKSIQIARRERSRLAIVKTEENWLPFRSEESVDSVRAAIVEPTVKGKALFKSLGSCKDLRSVENYCLEWYVGKEGWCGVHDEGSSIRFLYSLFFWECALFASVDDVFQSPYQDKPLDLYTEAFYVCRREAIEKRLNSIKEKEAKELRDEALALYGKYENIRAVGCYWSRYSSEDLAHIASGIGGLVLSHCFKLLSEDYAYWAGGFPDLTLWKTDGHPGDEVYDARFVEVKSARDNLSEKQRAWLLELQIVGADCEVCKVVERVTGQNAAELAESALDSVAITAIDDAAREDEVED